MMTDTKRARPCVRGGWDGHVARTDRGGRPPDAVMRIVVIGATGHIGGYLVPMLVEQGHDVVAVSRGQSRLYRDSSGMVGSIDGAGRSRG